MENVTSSTKQIIIQSSEAVQLRRELERVFMRIGGDSSYSINGIEKQLPVLVKFYKLIQQFKGGGMPEFIGEIKEIKVRSCDAKTPEELLECDHYSWAAVSHPSICQWKTIIGNCGHLKALK